MKSEVFNEYFPRVRAGGKKVKCKNKQQMEVRRKIEKLAEEKRLKESLKYF